MECLIIKITITLFSEGYFKFYIYTYTRKSYLKGGLSLTNMILSITHKQSL